MEKDKTIVEGKVIVVVCPKQKLVKIFERVNKRKNKLVQTYRFNEDIPKIKKLVQVEHYNHSIWSVADRSWTEDKEINVYDENVIQSIKERTLQYYNTQPPAGHTN